MTVRENLEAGKYEVQQPYLRRDKKYHKETQRVEALFKSDLELEKGLVGHPKADKLWLKAWEYGHPYGVYEILNYYEDLAELLD